MKERPSRCRDPENPALVLTRPEHLAQDDQVRVSGTMRKALHRNDGADVSGHGDHHIEGAGSQVSIAVSQWCYAAEINSHTEEARLQRRNWNSQKGGDEHPRGTTEGRRRERFH